MQKINLDLTPKKEKPIVYVSQYDNNRLFYIQLMEDGIEVQAAPNIDYSIVIRKPDNNIVTLAYPNVQPMHDGTIRVSLTEQACACSGDSFGELILEENEHREGTCNFILNVELSPEFGGIHSTSEIAKLKNQIDAIIEADAGPIVEDVAGPIVMEMVPEVIGDNYYTKNEVQSNYYNKSEIQTNYYTKAQTDNAINTALGHFLTGTLTTGNTSITLTDNTEDPIDNDSLIDIYTSIYGVNPISAVIDAVNHSITLEFEEQEADINIKVRVN